MSLGASLGRVRYFQGLGQGYAELVRQGMQGSSIVMATVHYLGVGRLGAVCIGVSVFIGWQLLAVTAGWAVWRWRVTHAEIEHGWQNNPYQVRQIQLLESIDTRLDELSGDREFRALAREALR